MNLTLRKNDFKNSENSYLCRSIASPGTAAQGAPMFEDPLSGQENFSAKLVEILNHGAVNAAMAIGYRTGIFDAMDTMEKPEPVEVIADTAGLFPRYVKEWLAVMATAGIIRVGKGNTGENEYFLPKSHADLLTRRAGNGDMGVYTQEIPLLTTSAMEAVADGFRTGRGLSYDHYPGFQAFMSELAVAKHRRVLVDTFLPSVKEGRMVERLSAGIRVCDLGCAEGVALMLMARAFPESDFVGMDVSEAAIEKAKRDAQSQGLSNVEFIVQDAAVLDTISEYEQAFDYVTAFDAIHDQTRPLEALMGVHHILSLGGLFSMVDIAARSDVVDNMEHPMAPFLYTVSLLHCMPVGLLDGGMGLGMMWGREKAIEMLTDAGFKEIRVMEIPEDPFNLHFQCRKSG